ncbi:tetratricopeptide repeat protein [Paracoccus cavernae]|uniref:Tetratricopeptide repeat protein n=1 Tax=Paracoccus cavernae TaxID=1571207 RepID=A0ABT8DAC1_9RHOB|nr:tetratricopeptide repeat protein [Paracoccus cavernae]
MTSLKDPETAAESHSNPEAALALGQLLLDTGQPLAAIKSFKSAAAGGNSTAMHLLGRMHQLGWGIPADPVLAADYYNRACSSGEPWSMFNLAELYLSGSGVAQSDDEAYRLYARRQAGQCPVAQHAGDDGRGLAAPKAPRLRSTITSPPLLRVMAGVASTRPAC